MRVDESVGLVPRFAILVDVGYLYAAAGELLFGASSRGSFRVDAESLIKAFEERAAACVRGELLRVYWFDAARDRVPTIDQRVIAPLPRVKLRLGNLNKHNQQKGVDAQIRQDLETLARHGAVTDAILIAGDEDMVPAVEAAQTYGVRIHLWGIEPSYGTNQAERLIWESDTVDVIDGVFVEPYFIIHPGIDQTERSSSVPPAAPSVPSPTITAVGTCGEDDATPAESERRPVVPAVPLPSAVFGGRKTGFGSSAAVDKAPAPATMSPPLQLGPTQSRMEEIGEHIAHKWILTRGRDNISDLLPGPPLPTAIDKELLIEAEKELGHSLRPYREARDCDYSGRSG
jgi:uncharacterized LabA/DUF88 family protein